MADPRTYTIEELQQLTGIDRRTIAYYTQQKLLPRVGRLGPRTRYPQLFLDRLRFIVRVRELEEIGALPTRRLSDIREAFQSLTDEQVESVATGERNARAVRELLANPGAGAESWEDDVLAELTADNFSVTGDERGKASLATLDDDLDLGAGIPADADPVPRMGSARGRKRSLMRAARARGSAPHPDNQTTAEIGPERADGGSPWDAMTMDAATQAGTLLSQVEAQAQQPRGDNTSTEKWLRVPVTENVVLSVRNLDERHAGPVEKLVQMLKRLLVVARNKPEEN